MIKSIQDNYLQCHSQVGSTLSTTSSSEFIPLTSEQFLIIILDIHNLYFMMRLLRFRIFVSDICSSTKGILNLFWKQGSGSQICSSTKDPDLRYVLAPRIPDLRSVLAPKIQIVDPQQHKGSQINGGSKDPDLRSTNTKVPRMRNCGSQIHSGTMDPEIVKQI